MKHNFHLLHFLKSICKALRGVRPDGEVAMSGLTGLNPPKDGMGTWSEKFLFFHFFFQTLALCFAFWCDMISPHGFAPGEKGRKGRGHITFCQLSSHHILYFYCYFFKAA